MNLSDLIAKLKAGQYDEVLKGSKYANARNVSDGWSACSLSPNAPMRLVNGDAMANAAQVIVLRQAVKELREALEYYGNRDIYVYGHAEEDMGDQARAVLDATAELKNVRQTEKELKNA